MTDQYKVTAGELRQIVEKYERLEQDKKEIADDQKEIMSEAKARGYSVPIIREVVKLRKQTPDDLAERDAVLEMYKAALGM